MTTTIQASDDLVKELRTRKMYRRESYEDVVWNLLEDSMELSEETKRRIEKAKKEISKGKFYTHEQVKEKLGFRFRKKMYK